MPADSFSEINLHVTWHTKNSAPSIPDSVRHHLYRYLEERAQREKGVVVHAVGGTENHVHLAATVPPTLQVSKWVGDLKGSSSFYINHRVLNRKGALDWQSGYGVVSFGTKDLPWVIDYVATQPERHRARKVAERLERYQGPLAANRP